MVEPPEAPKLVAEKVEDVSVGDSVRAQSALGGDCGLVPGAWHSFVANQVVVTRDRALPFLRNVTVVAVTSRVRGLPTEVPLGQRHGLARDCVANCDNIFTIPKHALATRRGALGPEDVRRLDDALRIALGLD